MSSPLPTLRTFAIALFVGLIPLPTHAEKADAGANILLNGDFAQPINTDRKRGKWALLGTTESKPFELIAEGYSIANGELTIKMEEVVLPGNISPTFVQFSQLIPPFTSGMRYRLSLEAKCTPANSSEFMLGAGNVVNGKMAGGLEWQTENPGGNWQTISYEFTAEDIPDARSNATRMDIRLQKPTGTLSIRNVQLVEIN